MRPDGGIRFGGAEVQAIETAKALQAHGIDVEIITPMTKNLGSIVHAFGTYNSYASILEYCKLKNIPFILSPIFYKNYTSAFNFYRDLHRTKRRHHHLKDRKLLINQADALLPNTEAEARLLVKLFKADQEKITVVPNAAESRFINATPHLFRENFNISYDFVLNVGRIEERKNQLNLIRAVKKAKLKLIIIGMNFNDDYYHQCKKEADGSVVFIDAIPHESPILESAYAACKVFALPSTLETPGISAIEAGLAGAKILASPNGGGDEYFGKYAKYPDVNSVDGIAASLLELWHEPSDDILPNILLSKYTWENVALETLKIYQKFMR